jgi:hypothetical protein
MPGRAGKHAMPDSAHAVAMFRSEADLYAPVKAFLEAQGFCVKGEVRGCDVVAVRGDEPPVIVELKLRFGLPLLLQGVDRLALSERVYLAVPVPRRASGPGPHHPDIRKLCRRIGLGLLAVHPRSIELVLEPGPYAPRKDKRRLKSLLGEHARRIGDPNRGGTTRLPLVTAYRQEALRCARLLERDGPASIKALREGAGAPNAGRILYSNVYGWFEGVARGVYRLTETGAADLARFAAAGHDGSPAEERPAP